MTEDFSHINIELKNNTKKEAYTEVECPICIDKFDKPVIVQCCGRSFCSSCLNKHLNSKSNCPMCRSIISKENIKPNILLDLITPMYDNDIDKNVIVKWKSMLIVLENYIIKNNKAPSYTFDTDNEAMELANWVGTQNFWYKNRWYIMKSDEIRNLWKEFNKKYVILNDINSWKYVLKDVEKYIKIYKKLPSYSNDKCHYYKELGWWVGTQKFWYEKKWYIMKNNEIRNLWKNFIDKTNHLNSKV